ncbi:MAG: Ycf66 family protein, partial [Cyanobacteriota bacterium]
MLATLGGVLALALGLAILLLPLLATELSRPRDSAWGAVVLLLGLVLVTSADRLSGSPMLGVLCGGLLIGRLGTEVTQARWRQLTPEEQRRLWSVERWSSSLSQVAASLGRAGQLGAGLLGGLAAWISERRQKPAHGKRWVRPELAPAPDSAPVTDAVTVHAPVMTP